MFKILAINLADRTGPLEGCNGPLNVVLTRLLAKILNKLVQPSNGPNKGNNLKSK